VLSLLFSIAIANSVLRQITTIVADHTPTKVSHVAVRGLNESAKTRLRTRPIGSKTKAESKSGRGKVLELGS
jgi:hypothetical protein